MKGTIPLCHCRDRGSAALNRGCLGQWLLVRGPLLPHGGATQAARGTGMFLTNLDPWRLTNWQAHVSSLPALLLICSSGLPGRGRGWAVSSRFSGHRLRPTSRQGSVPTTPGDPTEQKRLLLPGEKPGVSLPGGLAAGEVLALADVPCWGDRSSPSFPRPH
jgi:hypothetical protein